MATCILSLVCLLLALSLVECSAGDRSHQFVSCVYQCNRDLCKDGGNLSLVLRTLRWSCLENCQYECMHNVTEEDLRNNRPVKQFFGKVT